MVNIVTGINLYSDSEMSKYDYIGFTGNSTINSKGALVMGAGNAKVVRDKFKGIDQRLGEKISNLSRYLIVLDNDTNIFALQTKINWKDKSPIDLVSESINVLCESATQMPNQKFACPFPAVNHGGLSKNIVMPLIEKLPDNVFIYSL